MVRLRRDTLLSPHRTATGAGARTLLLAISLLGAAGRSAAGQRPESLVVVVHESVPVRDLTRENVRRYFLLRERFWHNGTRVTPVNLPAGSPIREAFSHAVLGAGSRDFSAYWIDLYFHGTLPPPTVGSEQAVLLFVERTPGAIGYVSASAAATLPAGVRAALRVAVSPPM